MAIIFGTAVAIALPTIQDHFQTNFTGIQWLVTAYTLTLGVLILISGSLGDTFGRKRIFNLGISVFILGSILAAFSRSIALLISSQIVIGLGGAMMVPGSLAIINTCIREKQRGRAIGLWTGFITGGAVLAPFIGGWLVESYGWPSIFYFNIIFGAISLLAGVRFIPTDENLRPTRIDWVGIVLAGVGMLGISYGLIQESLFSLGVGLVLLVTFAIAESRIQHPLVPLEIFKNPLVSGANLVTLLLYTALNGLIFFVILNFQQVHNFSPLITGIAFIPAPLLVTILAGPFGSWADRIGPRLPMILGPAIVAVAFGLLIFTGPNSNYFTRFLPGLILHGIGMAITVAPLTKSALAVKPNYSGVASGMNNAVARLSAPLAIAAFGLLVQDSLADGFRWIMAICTILAVAGTIVSYLTIRNPITPPAQ